MELNKIDFNKFINQSKIRFDADYENACVKSVTRLGLDWYHIDLRPDTCYRFNFRMTGCKGREIIFDFTCLDAPDKRFSEGRFRWLYNEGYVHPVISYDGKIWEKVDNIEKVEENYGTYRFKHTFTEDTAYVSHHVPYTYSDMIDWIKTLEDNPSVDIEIIGTTRNNIPQPALTVTNNKKNRDMVVIIAREDADEPGGSFGLEGFVDYLLNEKKYLLDKFVFKIVPMVGIDGVVAGATCSAGYGYSGRNWGLEKSPDEIENVKKFIIGLVKEGYKIILAGKLHGANCPAISKGIDSFLISDKKVLDLLDEGLKEYYNGDWESGNWDNEGDVSFMYPCPSIPQPRPIGYFERFIMDEFKTNNVFGTHILEYLPEVSKDGGKAVMNAVANFLDSFEKI